jgi:dihydrofolate reductase
VRKLVALVFNYSLNGLLADPGTDFWRFAFGLLDDHGGPDHDDETLAFLGGASAHLMGRNAYESFVQSIPTSTTNPWTPILNAGNKVVFSTTLTSVEWEGTTIASGDLQEEIDRLRDGDGYAIVWGGVGLWRSLMALDLIDEFRISHYPFIANAGKRLFEDVPDDYGLELISARPDSGGVIELHYRRRR